MLSRAGVAETKRVKELARARVLYIYIHTSFMYIHKSLRGHKCPARARIYDHVRCMLTLLLLRHCTSGFGRDGLDQHPGSSVAFAAVLCQDGRRSTAGYGVACSQYFQVNLVACVNIPKSTIYSQVNLFNRRWNGDGAKGYYYVSLLLRIRGV